MARCPGKFSLAANPHGITSHSVRHCRWRQAKVSHLGARVLSSAETGRWASLEQRGLRTSLSPKRIRSCRSEEHTSELQSRLHLVCRLLLEKKKENHNRHYSSNH